MVTGVRQFPLAQATPTVPALAGGWPFLWGPENALLDVMIARLLGGATLWGPITLYGPSGTGKSLLLHHLIEHWNTSSGLAEARLTTGRDWARDFQMALSDKRLSKWRSDQRETGCWGIDDIDLLSRFPDAERELLLLIDDLSANGIPLIVTSRTALNGGPLSAAVVSRLVGGFSVPIHLPEVETRRRFISRVAQQHDWLFDEAALEWLALQLSGSFLEIQSQLSIQLAHCDGRLTQQRVRAAFQRETTGNRRAGQTTRNSAATISQATKVLTSLVTGFFQVTATDLKGKSRRKNLVRARHIACHVAREQLGMSYYEIAKWLGKRDHSTIIHACKQAHQIIQQEPELAQVVEEISTALKARLT